MIQEDIHLTKLKIYKKAVLKSSIYDRREMSCCPNCKHRHYIKYGKFNGIQRYRCKICGKTFSKATGSLWSYSKKDAEKWIKFIELMVEKKSLNYCSKKLKISVITAFYWRHKVLHVLEMDKFKGQLNRRVLIMLIRKKENFKGSRNITKNERRMVRIVGLKDSDDLTVIKPIVDNRWFMLDLKDEIEPFIHKKAYVMPFNDRFLEAFGRNHNKRWSVRKNRKLYENKEIHKNVYDRSYIFFRNLSNWFVTYRGVATKYLNRYLKFFIMFDSKKLMGYMDILRFLINKNGFIRTGKEIRMMQ